ncbi:MAG: NAD-dependent epimerase/dehydratase family protein [Bacteroidetes bacterium]|nr:NAD-dependent epimerase/dehydratase family protein [Bacteroidota bacterium]
MPRILVIGASGQLGSELTQELKNIIGEDNVVASDRNISATSSRQGLFETLDVLDGDLLYKIVNKHKITQIYHLAAILSAVGEQHPKQAWTLNIDGLINVLDVAKEKKLDKIFWPSSIAVFGPNTPVNHTPQNTIMDPLTVYGISKLAGERWCEYYFHNYGVDTRSLRYPGLIGYKSPAGGGTTDYAVDIYHKAINKKPFECFLKEDTALPMMYMPDAIRSTIELMKADKVKIKVRSSYNINAMSFTPKEVADSIKMHIPDFKISYQPDFRQDIADSWPRLIDDSCARKDWGWNPEFDLNKMTKDILENLKKLKSTAILNTD